MARCSPERLRDLLLALLGLTTGAVDATAFDRLGHVFASVVTGNLILLGISAERANGKLAMFGGCALACYSLGVVLGRSTVVVLGRGARGRPRSPAGKRDESSWSPAATTALLCDLLLLVAFSITWELAGNHPDRTLQLLLLAFAAAAMGAQSCAVRQLGSFSTTYLTSTLTGMLEAILARSWSASTARGLAIIVAAVTGAAAAIALITEVRATLPILPLAPLVTVIITARRRLHGS